MKTAVFGGGCFWCTEDVFLALAGVKSVEPGYCGGHVEHPLYRDVCEGTTGHIEVIRIMFDESVVSYETLLDVFFATHDPTTPVRQGNDVGPQYQSVVYIESEAQRSVVEGKIKQLNDAGVFPAEICTLVRETEKFWPAEEYHHNYFERNPNQGYCQYVVLPKVMKVKEVFPDLLKTKV